MKRYWIDNRSVDEETPEFAAAIEAAYGSKSRPRCACQAGGVEMYVAKVAGKYVVKRMPNTGDQHASGCDSYAPPPELSGLGQVLGSAIEENVDDGKTSLKLGFSLTKGAGRTASNAAAVESDSVKSDGSRLTLRGTLHYLWEQAGFNTWSPAMEGKRSWFVVRKFLLRAAADKRAKGQDLAEVLYIPETFRSDEKDAIAQRRTVQFSKIAGANARGRRLNILIGEVKEISKAHHGYKLIVKHVPDMAFMLNEDLHRRLQKRFAQEIALWSSAREMAVIAIGTFSVNSTGVTSVEELSLMVVDQHWIPVESMPDLMLVQRMVEQRRRFAKGLRYNLPSPAPLACAVLTDTEEHPVALYIVPAGAEDELVAATEGLMKDSHLEAWSWRAGEQEMPALPLAARPNPHLAAATAGARCSAPPRSESTEGRVVA